MRKKLLSMMLTLALIISALAAVPMTVQADSMMVVTVGADLTEEQKNMILKYFNVSAQNYTTITVTNADEWAHLGSYMSRDVVGTRTISCALIRPMNSGGIQVKTANLTYVTSNMIASNLATAGVTNCEVLAAAPFPVSGTGALTGTLMAYENLTGVTLNQAKKDAAAQEFATTYELGQSVGQQQAQQIVNDMKMQVINGTLEQDNSISNDEITEIVNNVVNNYTNNVTTTNNTGLTAEDAAALQELAIKIAKESYEQGTIDALAQIQSTLEGQTKTESTAATTQIEQNAAPTADPAAEAPAAADASQTPDEAPASAADQALAQDSILVQTDESALAGTTEDGSVISSSTAESTIDTSVATNLDQQIEEAQNAAAEQAATDTGIPEATDSAVIPEATDSTVIPEATDDGSAPAAVDDGTDVSEFDPFSNTDTAQDPAAVEAPAAEEAPVSEEAPAADDAAVTAEPEAAPEAAAPAMVRDTAVTVDDVNSGNAQLVSYNVTADGSAQASGSAPIALVLPYDNLVPVSGALHVTDNTGAEVAALDITNPAVDASQTNILTVGMDSTISLPGGWSGYTKLVILPKDVNTGAAFTPVAGQNYTYTLDAQFAQTTDPAQTDGAPLLNVAIDNYTPYAGSVVEAGFVTDGYTLSGASYMNGAQGSVQFPSDMSAAYAVVTVEDSSMAMAAVDSGNAGVTAGSGEKVVITPVQAGKVTLTIRYYAAAPEEGMAVDPSTAVATVNCSIQFT